MTDRVFPAHDHLQKQLQETLFPDPSVIELRRDPYLDYRLRFAQSSPSVAELFHENSKLGRHILPATRIDEEKMQEIRNWYTSTAYRPDVEDFVDIEAVYVQLEQLEDGRLIEMVVRKAASEDLLFSLNLLFLLDGQLFLLPPTGSHAYKVKRFTPSDLQRLWAAVLPEDGVPTDGTPILMIVGCPWRYMLLTGARGYRHMLVDAGRLIERMYTFATLSLTRLEVFRDFYDREVDSLLDLDGVEKSTLCVVVLSSVPGHQPVDEGGQDG